MSLVTRCFLCTSSFLAGAVLGRFAVRPTGMPTGLHAMLRALKGLSSLSPVLLRADAVGCCAWTHTCTVPACAIHVRSVTAWEQGPKERNRAR